MGSNIQLIRERLSYWVTQGKTGAALYQAMATDSSLPSNFTPQEVIEVAGLTPATLLHRRADGQAPSFIRVGKRTIVYPRSDLFAWLTSRHVARGHHKAADEYTQVPAE